MSALVDGGGRSVFLGTQIGKGGEATISAVAGRPELVAKIWHEPASAERAGKLRWMLATPRPPPPPPGATSRSPGRAPPSPTKPAPCAAS